VSETSDFSQTIEAPASGSRGRVTFHSISSNAGRQGRWDCLHLSSCVLVGGESGAGGEVFMGVSE
jgi:hypothetical protein